MEEGDRDRGDGRQRPRWPAFQEGPGASTRRGFLAVALATATGGCIGSRQYGTAVGDSGGSGGESVSTERECDPQFDTATRGQLAVPYDSRVALGCRGSFLDRMDDLEAWDTYEGSVAPDPSTSFDGGQSARLTATRSENRAWAYRRFSDPVDLTDRDLSLAVDPGQGETRLYNFDVQVLAPDPENRLHLSRPLGGLGGWFRADLGPTEVVGAPDLANVREIRIHGWVGDDAATQFHVDALRTTPKLDRGAVVLQFDDNLRSQYETAYPIMQEYGMQGDLSTVPRLTDREAHVGLDGLSELTDAGWDVVSHPHPPEWGTSLPSLSRDEQRRLIVESKEWLVDHGFERGAQFVVWPSAQASATTRAIGSEFHHLGYSGGVCPSGRPTGPLTVGRVDGNQVDRTKRLVDMAERFRQVTVVMYHAVGDGNRGIGTAAFRESLDHVASADVDVLTSSDLWEIARPDEGSSIE